MKRYKFCRGSAPKELDPNAADHLPNLMDLVAGKGLKLQAQVGEDNMPEVLRHIKDSEVPVQPGAGAEIQGAGDSSGGQKGGRWDGNGL